MFLTAAFTGLRMGELLALRWRDVDFAGATIRVRASYAGGQLTTPKSGKVRACRWRPTSPRRWRSSAGERTGWVTTTSCSSARPALSRRLGARRRYKDALSAAGLRPLRFHDLRHTFGTRMIAKADIRRVQEWMGHADIQTTMRTCTTPRGGGRAAGGRGVRGGRGVGRARPGRSVMRCCGASGIWRFAGRRPRMSQDVPKTSRPGCHRRRPRRRRSAQNPVKPWFLTTTDINGRFSTSRCVQCGASCGWGRRAASEPRHRCGTPRW